MTALEKQPESAGKAAPRLRLRQSDGGNPAPDGLRAASWEAVALADIDSKDLAFQYRFPAEFRSLKESLKNEGQREPIDLIGKRPYRIVDGFRRVLAATALNWPTIKAFVHRNLSDDDAYRIAFTKNVVRRNLTPLERAQAMVVAMRKRGLKEGQLRDAFGLSEKQVKRYLELLDFPEPIKKILDGDAITMAHAKALAAFGITDDAEKWRKRILAEGLNAKSLRALLMRERGKRPGGRPKTYMRRVGSRVRMYAFTIGKDAPKAEREKVVQLLQEAIDALKG